MEGKILLVDGNSILNRGYYALPLLSDKNGIYTNGVLGFLNILFKTLEEEKPDFLIVAFDVGAPTFRHKMYSEYKGTRKPAPDELKMQFPIIREVLSSMNVNIVEREGFEADDLLGTLAKKAEREGLDVTLLSGDRDLLQIASGKIKIAIPKTSMGKTETHLYYDKDVLSEYGVTPVEFIEVKALQGDSSDNIPGVPKVGPKTATELIATYHNLENLYEHLSDITKKALHTNLSENRDQAFFSRTLSRIETNAPIDLDFERSRNVKLLNEASMDVLLKYSLKSAINKLEALDADDGKAVKEGRLENVEYSTLDDFSSVCDCIRSVSKEESVSVFATDEGIALKFSGECVFIPFSGFVTREYLRSELSKALEGASHIYTVYVKNSYEFIGEYRTGIEDAEILAYLLDPVKGDYPITYLCERYLSEFYGDEKEVSANSARYGAIVVSNAEVLCKDLREKVKELGMDLLFSDIEMPLSYVLYSMEREGVLVDRNGLVEYGKRLEVRITNLEKEIYEKSGVEFNINSPKQLGEVLFERLGLPSAKKTKSGYSTAADVLEKLAVDYPVVSDILEYRMLTKLYSTYALGLESCIADDGRIHTHFNQTITATGRISSTDPNLQNIPVRTELGRELRKVFLPKAGYVFVDADYSQIELRLMAHMSEDANMIADFKAGRDIHRSTASRVFGVPFSEVTPLQRRNAKAVNFGIIYGISSFGLSRDIDTDVKTAKRYIEDYFEKYPDIRKYLDDTIECAKKDGYTKTLFNRIRPIPELKSSNFMQRSFGERVAMNAPLQGTAADIMKIAMIGIYYRLLKETPASKMLIQVHDEVLIEALESEKDKVIEIVTQEMQRAASLSVDLTAEANTGYTWYDAK